MTEGLKQLTAVIGWPISHSLSPLLHGFWFDHYQIDGAMMPLAVRPEDLADVVRSLPHIHLRGASVTLPHKTALLNMLDHISPLARRLGAVNLITVAPDGSLHGDNSDVFGFCENLAAAGWLVVPAKPVVVLGAGGASRAVVMGLHQIGCQEIRIINRDQQKAAALVDDLHIKAQIFSWQNSAVALADAALLVNTTSLGMQDQPPLELDLTPLPPSAWVNDIIYKPLHTPLLLAAQQRGHRIVDGLGMLLHQGRPAFHAWFGIMPEVTDQLRTFVQEGL